MRTPSFALVNFVSKVSEDVCQRNNGLTEISFPRLSDPMLLPWNAMTLLTVYVDNLVTFSLKRNANAMARTTHAFSSVGRVSRV